MAAESPSPRSDNLRRLGIRFLIGGLVVGVIGAVALIAGGGPLDVVGSLLAAIGALVGVVGLGLVLSGVVGGRAAKGKPFA